MRHILQLQRMEPLQILRLLILWLPTMAIPQCRMKRKRRLDSSLNSNVSVCLEESVVLNQNKGFINESQQVVSSLQKIEGAMNSDESSLATKMLCLGEKQKELDKAIVDGKDFHQRLQAEAAKYQNINVTEENVMEFVKPTTELYDLWLKQEAKRKSRENCIQVVRKLYEDKKITLPVFLDLVDKLASKEFTNIYKKNRFETLIRREEKAKA